MSCFLFIRIGQFALFPLKEKIQQIDLFEEKKRCQVSHCHHHNLAYNDLIYFHDGNYLNLFIYRLKLILTLMFCSCCEFGSSRSPLAAKASILDREHCARFHCDSAWSNLKASVVTSDLSRMLIVLYCDFQAPGDWQTARQPRNGVQVRQDCDGAT